MNTNYVKFSMLLDIIILEVYYEKFKSKRNSKCERIQNAT